LVLCCHSNNRRGVVGALAGQPFGRETSGLMAWYEDVW
jgi:hypothetical protein